MNEISAANTNTTNTMQVQQNNCLSSNTIEQAVLDIKIEIDSIETTVVNIESEVLSFNDGTMATSFAAEHKNNITRVLGIINQEFKSLINLKLSMSDRVEYFTKLLITVP